MAIDQELVDWLDANYLRPLISALTGDPSIPDLSALGVWAQQQLGQVSAVPAENLVGSIQPATLSLIPASHISDTTPNLVSQGSFALSSSVDPNAAGWAWDKDLSGVAGSGGSAKATCNGALRELYSTQAIPVRVGERLQLTCDVKTASLVSTGSPIVLSLVPFVGKVAQPVVTIASRGVSTSWVSLAGEVYLVPAGVTSVIVRLAVTATATGGAVYFDNVSLVKTGLMSSSMVTGLDAALGTVQQSVITVANLANQPQNRAWWESPSPFEEVSVPRVLLGPRVVPGQSTYQPQTVSLAAGTLHLIPIRMRSDQIINEVGFITTGATPPTHLYLGLYAVDMDTGTHTLVYNFGDVRGDINTGTTGPLYEQRIQTTYDILGPAGTVYSLGILPTGAAFAVAGVVREQIITAATLYPQSSTETLGSQTSLPSTVAETSLNHTFGYRVFASIGQTWTGPPDQDTLVTLTDTFNVPNTGNWSSASWLPFKSASAKFWVSAGNLYGGTTGVAGGVASFWASALATTKLNTDNQSVELTIGSTWDAATYGHVTVRGYVRCKADGSSGVAMHVDYDGSQARVRIANIANMTSIGTVRATATVAAAAIGDRFRLEAVGDTYQCYRNDVAISGAVWSDPTEIVPVGKTWRYVGMGSGEYTTIGNYYDVAGINQWVGKDIQP